MFKIGVVAMWWIWKSRCKHVFETSGYLADFINSNLLLE